MRKKDYRKTLRRKNGLMIGKQTVLVDEPNGFLEIS